MKDPKLIHGSSIAMNQTLTYTELVVIVGPLLTMDKFKVETPIHDNIGEMVTWECKEHAMKS